MAYSSLLSLPSFTSAPRAGPLNPSRSILPSTLHSRSSFRPVCCQAEKDGSEKQHDTPVVPPSASALAPPPPRKAPGVSTKFSGIFAFGGPAPERINGRLAMIGFMSALAVELARGDDLLAQLSSGGSTWFVGTAVVLSLASLVPLVKGVTAQSRSGGLMTADAEMWNGRFAMLGLVALAFTEYLKGGPLV